MKVAREGVPSEFHVYPRISDQGTLGDTEKIIWSSIRHLCSRGVIENVAFDVFGHRNRRNIDSISNNAKLYIQQASAFYEAASASKPNTAPLLYYYSFLNLAKGLCELRNPRFHGRNECYKHGLSWRPDPLKIVDPTKDVISITQRGVWHVLWESMTLKPYPAPNSTRIRIKNLLQFCPEISVETELVCGSDNRLIEMVEPLLLHDADKKQAWIRFSVYRQQLTELKLTGPKFMAMLSSAGASFQEVQSTKNYLRTFEQGTPVSFKNLDEVRGLLQTDIVALNAFTFMESNAKLTYAIPDQRKLKFNMPQLLVLYSILFWLGSLVRYDPHSVDALLDSPYWTMIDGFMSQSRLWLLEQFEWALYQAETRLWSVR